MRREDLLTERSAAGAAYGLQSCLPLDLFSDQPFKLSTGLIAADLRVSSLRTEPAVSMPLDGGGTRSSQGSDSLEEAPSDVAESDE